MRQSDVYKINVPELGDRSDITVVSDAILAGEKNTIGNVQWMKATNSGNIITLTSETRTAKMSKYYNGLAVQFVSPINVISSSGAQIKIDDLNAQPFTTTNDIEIGNVVCAVYSTSGFTANKMGVAVIDNLTTADSKKALSANQGKVLNEKKADKTIQVIAGNGLTGGGDLNANRTLNVASANDGITVNANNIQLNTVDNLTTTSTTKPLSSNQGKILSEKVDNAVATVANKLDKGAVSAEYDTAKKIEDKINVAQSTADNKVSKTGDTMTGVLKIQAYQGLKVYPGDKNNTYSASISAENGFALLWRANDGGSKASEFLGINNNSTPIFRKSEGEGISNYTDNIILHQGNFNDIIGTNKLNTESKDLVNSINEVFYKRRPKYIGSVSQKTDIYSVIANLQQGYYSSNTVSNKWENLPIGAENAFELIVGSLYQEKQTGYKTAILRNTSNNSIFVNNYVRGRVDAPWDLWAEILTDETSPYFGITGLEYNGYIQNPMLKEKGKAYKDNVTKRIYRCEENTYETSVTNKFTPIDNNSLANRNNNALKLYAMGIADMFFGQTSICIPKNMKRLSIRGSSAPKPPYNLQSEWVYDGKMLTTGSLDLNFTSTSGNKRLELRLVYNTEDEAFRYYHLENVSSGEDNYIAIYGREEL